MGFLCNATIVSSTSLASCVNNGPPVDVAGLSATITLDAPARISFYIVMNLKNQGCFACGAGYTNLRVVKATGGGTSYNTELMVVTPNSEGIGINTGPMIVDLPAGSPTYKVTIQDHTANGFRRRSVYIGGTLIWQIFYS